MPRGGRRPGAGRPKGVRDGQARASKSRSNSRPALESKDPLQFMLEVMNDPAQPKARRDRMAIAAAPFVHKKQGEGGKKEQRQTEAGKIASGSRFTPQAPPRKPH